MGKKKFIDKKHATTYTLVFRSTEDQDEPDNSTEGYRVLVPAGEQGGAAAALPRDPRALYAHFFGDEEEEEFDNLLSGYDDDELGDLEGDDRVAGRIGAQQLNTLMVNQQQQQQQLGDSRLASILAIKNGMSGDAGYADDELEDEEEDEDEFLSESDLELPHRASAGGRGARKAHKDSSNSKGHGGGADNAGDEVSVAPSIYERPRDEPAEDKKARKAAVKAAQKEARATKKALKQLYTAEAGKMQRQQASTARGAVFVIP
eukprot:gene2214-2529_t